MKYFIFFLGAVAFCLAACKTDISGDLLPNEPPETHTTVDTIIRFGDDRLESQVEIEWWGDDPDGYIVGYEYTFDEVISEATAWSFTPSQDSVFLLSTPPGEDTLDFRFSVRAIDNRGLKDPSPASAYYPVRNSPPSVNFVPGTNNPVKTFPVLKFFWEASDPDGDDNLKNFEIFWNDTTGSPFTLDITANSATLIALDPMAETSDCEVLINNSTDPLAGTISGLKLNDYNNLYIRVRDKSDALSPFAVTDSVFVKKVNSNVLMVDAYSFGGAAVEDFYGAQLTANGIGVFDTIQIFEEVDGETTQLAADNLTQARIFNFFDVILWFGNNAENSLSLAQRTTADFFEKGGKLYMATYVSSSFDEQSDFLDFTPIASLVEVPDTTLILDLNAELDPSKSDWPVLQSTSIVGIVRPMNLTVNAEQLYEAELKARDNVTLDIVPWDGPSIVMASKADASGNTNFVISTLEVHKLDGLGNIDELFEKILIEEFGL